MAHQGHAIRAQREGVGLGPGRGDEEGGVGGGIQGAEEEGQRWQRLLTASEVRPGRVHGAQRLGAAGEHPVVNAGQELPGAENDLGGFRYQAIRVAQLCGHDQHLVTE